MAIKPIKRVKVGEQVFLQLKKMLIDGEWLPGSKIPSENELAELFNVSRITVRQALQRLNALGLIETRLGEGSFVKDITVGDSMNELIPIMYLGDQSTSQVFEFRLIIETGCARLAAQRATSKDVKELKRLLQKMKDCSEKNDYYGFGNADLAFHLKIADMTQNTLFVKTNSIVQDILEASMHKVIEKMGFDNGIYYHEQIIDAFEKNDAKKAEQMMQKHIEKNSEFFREEK